MDIADQRVTRNASFVSGATWIVAGVVLAVVGSAPVVRGGEYPRELQRILDLGDQRAFAGDLAGAAEQYKAARTWVAQPRNRKLLTDAGYHWSTVKTFIEGVDGWITSERGNLIRATELLKAAHKAHKDMMADRYAAIVSLLYGDVEFAQGFTAIPLDQLPEDVQKKFAKADFHFKQSKIFYTKAADMFIGAFPDGANAMDFEDKRLRGRSESALGRCATVDKECSQAKRYLDEAELMFRAMPHHDLFIKPDTKYPLTLKQVRRNLDALKDVPPDRKNEYVSEYARHVVEWMQLLCDKANLSLRCPDAGVNNGGDDPERVFSKVRDLCDENLGRGHPLRCRADVALGSYYVQKARQAQQVAAREPPGPEKDRLLRAVRSYYLDAVWAVQELGTVLKEKAQDTHPLWCEKFALELIAHDAGFAIEGRKRDVVLRDLNAWLDTWLEGQKVKPR